jgi:hypothetical protein
LAYEPAPRWQRPPAWVLGVVAAYLLLLTGLLALPALAGWQDWDIWWWPLGATVAGLMLAWLSLLWLPIRAARRRRITRRSLWIPIIASGFLAAALLYGLILATNELAFGKNADWAFGWGPLAVTAGGWAVWTVVLWMASRGKSPERFAGRMNRGILAGSALELLVAVPAHVVVRRREECCAGIGTGVGICCGLAVMVVALGPGVAVLYYRRVRQISHGGKV